MLIKYLESSPTPIKLQDNEENEELELSKFDPAVKKRRAAWTEVFDENKQPVTRMI